MFHVFFCSPLHFMPRNHISSKKRTLNNPYSQICVNAIIAGVPEKVCVAVDLVSVGVLGAVVASVAHTIAVEVQLVAVGHFDAVVDVVCHAWIAIMFLLLVFLLLYTRY